MSARLNEAALFGETKSTYIETQSVTRIPLFNLATMRPLWLSNLNQFNLDVQIAKRSWG